MVPVIVPGVKLVQDMTDRDNNRHDVPADANERWQENWILCWYDPVAKVGGFHHMGLQVPKNQADIWTALIVDGKVVGQEQSLTLPLPDDDLDDFRLGPMHLRNKVPLRAQHMEMTYATASCDVLYESWQVPVRYSMDFEGADVGDHHYESFGRVTGTVSAGDRTVAVDGIGFQDHSWGPREYGEVITFRNCLAGFGPDLFLDVLDMTSRKSRTIFGYVYDRGTFHPMRMVDSLVHVPDDGHSPAGYDARIWTAGGTGGYHLTGKADAFHYDTHEDDYFQTNGYMSFELGGRLGAGILDVRELGSAAPWHLRHLGIIS